MLENLTTRKRADLSDAAGQQAAPYGHPAFGISDFIVMLRRRIKLVAGVAAVVVGAVMVYSLVETPRYAATATIVLDSSKARPNEEIASLVATGAGTDQTMADSQVEVIKSESIASAVIDKLKLDEDPQFYAPKKLIGRLAGGVRGLFSQGRQAASPRNLALDAARDGLTVERVGTTYAITLSFGYPDPARSAEITNAFVDAYQISQSQARDQQSERTTSWLRTRLDELRNRSLDIESQMQGLRQGNAGAGTGGRTLALLRDLERESETYRTLYQTFLSRHQQVVEQESLTIDQARVVTRARPPVEPVYPRKSLFLALSLFVGGALGVGAAALLEVADRSVRTPNDVAEASGLPFLGLLPLTEKPGAAPVATAALLDYVAREPGSLYAETMRSLWGRIDAASTKRAKVMGFCSISPGDAVSVVASNFAHTVASLGRNCLLVDADIRRPTLGCDFASRSLGHGGIVAPNLRLATLQPPDDGAAQSFAAVYPAVSSIVEHGADECVVIKLPPLGIADAAALARLVDHLVLVVAWGNDSRETLRSVVESQGEIYDKWLGALLDGVDIVEFGRYDRSGLGAVARRLDEAYFRQGAHPSWPA